MLNTKGFLFKTEAIDSCRLLNTIVKITATEFWIFSLREWFLTHSIAYLTVAKAIIGNSDIQTKWTETFFFFSFFFLTTFIKIIGANDQQIRLRYIVYEPVNVGQKMSRGISKISYNDFFKKTISRIIKIVVRSNMSCVNYNWVWSFFVSNSN